MGLKQVMCQDCQTAGFFCFSSEVSVVKSVKGGEINRTNYLVCVT